MTRLRLVFSLLAALLLTSCQTGTGGVIILVRHAERADDSEDPPLSQAGEARAQALAEMLKDAGVAAIFSSPYRRNIQTAEPLARRLGIEPIILPSEDLDAIIERIRTDYRDEIVLVIGHSNTVPDLLERYGYPGEITIEHGEYDNLFFVMTRSGKSPLFLRLHF